MPAENAIAVVSALLHPQSAAKAYQSTSQGLQHSRTVPLSGARRKKVSRASKLIVRTPAATGSLSLVSPVFGPMRKASRPVRAEQNSQF